MKTVNKAKETGKASVSDVCSSFGIKRDAYYKHQKRQTKRESVAAQVVDLVKEERRDQPRVGTRKLLKALKHCFEIENIKVGRDCLFDILRLHNMLITKRKASCKTTNSYHHFHKYNNLVKDVKVTRPNQVWVSDISVPQLSGVRDEGRPLATSLQERVANHRKRRKSKAYVVSVTEKVP